MTAGRNTKRSGGSHHRLSKTLSSWWQICQDAWPLYTMHCVCVHVWVTHTHTHTVFTGDFCTMHLRNSNSVQWYKAALKHSLQITCLWHLSHKHKYSVLLLSAFNIRPFITISCVNVSHDAFSPPMFSIHTSLISITCHLIIWRWVGISLDQYVKWSSGMRYQIMPIFRVKGLELLWGEIICFHIRSSPGFIPILWPIKCTQVHSFILCRGRECKGVQISKTISLSMLHVRLAPR